MILFWGVLPQKCCAAAPAFFICLLRQLLRLPRRQTKKASFRKHLCRREEGIRTLDALLEHTHFPGVRLRPLGHLSLEVAKKQKNTVPALEFIALFDQSSRNQRAGCSRVGPVNLRTFAVRHRYEV